ncbi:WD-40 repeat-containing protein [Reticulomyxa filosa]|uniref:WD-40 repeat-containing protein n=1 Tax=Reticulomyxa filosa TaxID=46433 RepID=X6MFD8_RETFI|nr:WD-40 repeat-containing protein [Reticulomyxa filosa]|eukprot:ETO11755.1 WD-40 repeat-containing protein [Reticulomyxa filosa]
MKNLGNDKQGLIQPALVSFLSSFQKLAVFNFYCVVCDLRLQKPKEEEMKLIIQYWIRTLKIKLVWTYDFEKFIVNYANTTLMLDAFCSSSKLRKTFTGHTNVVNSVDFSTFDDGQFICSGSSDQIIRIWDVDTDKQIQSFNGHLNPVYCVKFSPYHYHKSHRNVVCSSSYGKAILFWDIKDNKQLQIFKGHNEGVYGLEFSQFNGGRYLCSGSGDSTIRLWDVETSKSLHVFNGHKDTARCVDISPLQSNNNNDNNNNKMNNIGVIGGNGYTICSGSYDDTISIWDIETAKRLIEFKGHEHAVISVKYGSNELANTILSGSNDRVVCLWDIRSGKLIREFYGHKNHVTAVAYSPFVVNNTKIGGSSNVLCSGSSDNTIRFWDVRLNMKEVFLIRGENECGITSLKFISLKKKGEDNKSTSNYTYDLNLCFGSYQGPVCIWG